MYNGYRERPGNVNHAMGVLRVECKRAAEDVTHEEGGAGVYIGQPTVNWEVYVRICTSVYRM